MIGSSYQAKPKKQWKQWCNILKPRMTDAMKWFIFITIVFLGFVFLIVRVVQNGIVYQDNRIDACVKTIQDKRWCYCMEYHTNLTSEEERQFCPRQDK